MCGGGLRQNTLVDPQMMLDEGGEHRKTGAPLRLYSLSGPDACMYINIYFHSIFLFLHARIAHPRLYYRTQHSTDVFEISSDFHIRRGKCSLLTI